MKIGFLSDLHITYNTNMIEHAVQEVAKAASEAGVDKLFLVGDTTNNYTKTLEFVDLVKDELGIEVYTIFGNHEYWSLTYDEAKALDEPNYISGRAVDLDENNVVVAIDGFFDYSFVTEVKNLANLKLPQDKYVLTSMGKRHFDLTRNQITEYEKVFDEMYEDLERMLKENKDKNIILITHYVPHEDFVIYQSDNNIWNSNNSFMGSVKYAELAEKYGVDKVIFGHTHSQWHKTINGVEYICNAVGYRNIEYENCRFRDRVADRLTVVEI